MAAFYTIFNNFSRTASHVHNFRVTGSVAHDSRHSYRTSFPVNITLPIVLVVSLINTCPVLLYLVCIAMTLLVTCCSKLAKVYAIKAVLDIILLVLQFRSGDELLYLESERFVTQYGTVNRKGMSTKNRVRYNIYRYTTKNSRTGYDFDS